MSTKTKTFKKRLLLIFIISILAFNVIAYNHAHAMMFYSDNGARTSKPEELSFGEKTRIIFTGINVPKPQNDQTPAEYALDYETHTIEVSDEILLEGWLIPHEDPIGNVLMFHGYAAAKASILSEAAAFHELGYDVFMIDFRGSGGSSLSETSIGYFEAEDVAAAAKYVQKNFDWDDLIFYGQSMGSAAILKAVNDGKISPDMIILESVFDKALSTVNNRFAAMNIPSFPSSHVLIFWGSVIQNFNGFSHNPIDYATKIQSPILFLFGENDPRVTLDQANAVYEQVQTEKELVIFENAGHESYYATDPQKWNTEIKEFLENNDQ